MRLPSIVLVVAALAAVPSSALAAPVRDGLAPAPRAAFDEGARLYKRARFVEARETFLAAFATSGEPRILFNVAVCEKALGRYSRALATLKKSLTTGDHPLPAEYVARASEAIATLSRYVAFVTIDASVEGAAITVDGEPLRETPAALESGTHAISATKDGFEAANATVTVKAGEAQRVMLELSPSVRPGVAKLSCAGAERCELRLGDEVLGLAPLTLTRAAGGYVVRAYVGGKPWAEERIALANGKTIEVALTARALPMARLRVTSDEPEDLVAVDGKQQGKSGGSIELEVGEHRVVLSRADGATKSIDLVLRENESRDLRVSFEKKGGLSPWWFVGGGALVAGVVTTALVVSSSRSTTFQGSSSGTLNPYVVPASTHGVTK